jgi:hypothetical protein
MGALHRANLYIVKMELDRKTGPVKTNLYSVKIK